MFKHCSNKVQVARFDGLALFELRLLRNDVRRDGLIARPLGNVRHNAIFHVQEDESDLAEIRCL